MSEPTFAWQTRAVTKCEAGVDAAEKPMVAPSALEKQSLCVDVLRNDVGKSLTSYEILQVLERENAFPVDVSADFEVDQMLRRNGRIRVTLDDEGDPRYAYLAKFTDVRNYASLLSRVARSEMGVRADDFDDCYDEVKEDIEKAIVAGAVVAVKDASERSVALFGRGQPYLTALSGELRVTKGLAENRELATTEDTTAEVRRGDAVALVLLRTKEEEEDDDDDDKKEPKSSSFAAVKNREPLAWFRVSSRVATGDKAQPKRAERPLSASSLRAMHSQNKYVDPHDAVHLPLATAVPVSAGPERGVYKAVKHGCTNDVRTLWLETAADTPEDGAQLERKLADAKLSKGARPRAKRPPKRVAHTDHPKHQAKRQRTFNRFHKLTNTHLFGTEIGDVLAAANDAQADSATGGASFDTTK